MKRKHGTARARETCAESATFSSIGCGMNDREHAIDRSNAIEHFSRAVGGAVVDDDDFPGGGQRDLQKSIDHLPHRASLVEHRHNNRNQLWR